MVRAAVVLVKVQSLADGSEERTELGDTLLAREVAKSVEIVHGLDESSPTAN